MLVSLAVIALALAIVGVVFAITVKTAGQSAAYTQTHNWVRQFTQQIEEDLRHCVPSQSILVMVGRTQAAALTKGDLDAGKFYRVLIGNPQLAGPDPEYGSNPADYAEYSNPRADLLMFFSNRPTASVAPNPAAGANDPYAGGVKFAPILVTYGHAALGQPTWNGASYDFPTALSHIEDIGGGATDPAALSRLPAVRWHLARRATIIRDPGTASSLADAQFSSGPLGACGNLPRCAPYTDHGFALPGDAAYLNLQYLLDILGPRWGLYWTQPPAFESPYNFPTSILSTLSTLMYSTYTTFPAPNHHVATVLEEVPVELNTNMGVHMLPGCVWFQVEFLMPEDPRNSAEYSDPDPTLAYGVDYSSRSDMPRWTTVQDGFTYVFVPDTPENRNAIALQVNNAVGGLLQSADRLSSFARLDQDSLNHYQASDALSYVDANGVTRPQRIIRLWPYAIRITVRVWDARGRLDEPIVRSIVHRFD